MPTFQFVGSSQLFVIRFVTVAEMFINITTIKLIFHKEVKQTNLIHFLIIMVLF